VLDEVVTSS